MKKTIARLVGAAVLAASFTACAQQDVVAAADGPTRIMIVGDSITQGATGDHTWRYFLWKSLKSSSETFDFVGPRNTVHKAGTDSEDEVSGVGYADPGFDQDHAARWGMGTHWIDGTINWETGEWDYSKSLGAGNDVTGLVTNYRPDVVVNMLGFNDLNPRGWWKVRAAAVAAKQREFVIKAREVNPEVTVLLGQIGHSWAQGQKAVDYNAELTALAAELDTPAARVVLVPVAIDDPSDVYDGAHPNIQGETKIAEKVRATLASVGVGVGSVQVKQLAVKQPPVAAPPAAKPLGKITGVKARRVPVGVRFSWVNAKNSVAVEVSVRSRVKTARGWKPWGPWRQQTAPAPSTRVWDALARPRVTRYQVKLRPVSKAGVKGASVRSVGLIASRH